MGSAPVDASAAETTAWLSEPVPPDPLFDRPAAPEREAPIEVPAATAEGTPSPTGALPEPAADEDEVSRIRAG